MELLEACGKGDLERVKELLPTLSHDNLIIQNIYGDTPLHLACDDANLEIVKELLKHLNYDDLIIQDSSRFTPLHFACSYRYIEIIKELLRSLRKDDLIIQNIYGRLPLNYVCYLGELEMMKLLILNGSSTVDFPRYNAFMKSIKWSKHEHKNVMHIQTRQNMQMVFMVYKRYDMLEKL